MELCRVGVSLLGLPFTRTTPAADDGCNAALGLKQARLASSQAAWSLTHGLLV